MDSMLFVGLATLKTPLRAEILTGIVRFWHCAADATEARAAKAAIIPNVAMLADFATRVA